MEKLTRIAKMEYYVAANGKVFPKKNPNGGITTKSSRQPKREVAADTAAIATPYGSIGKLPKELRDSIYAMVFACGSTALTVTSQALNQDTRKTLYRHGICRLTIKRCFAGASDPSGYESHFEKSQRRILPALATVQNLKLNFTYPSSSFYRTGYNRMADVMSKTFLHDLISSMEKPRHCHAVFKLGTYEKCAFVVSCAMGPLRAFESVTMEFNGWDNMGGYSLDMDNFTEREMVKTIAQLLERNEDKERAPKLKIIWNGIVDGRLERRITLFPPNAISLG